MNEHEIVQEADEHEVVREANRALVVVVVAFLLLCGVAVAAHVLHGSSPATRVDAIADDTPGGSSRVTVPAAPHPSRSDAPSHAVIVVPPTSVPSSADSGAVTSPTYCVNLVAFVSPRIDFPTLPTLVPGDPADPADPPTTDPPTTDPTTPTTTPPTTEPTTPTTAPRPVRTPTPQPATVPTAPAPPKPATERPSPTTVTSPARVPNVENPGGSPTKATTPTSPASAPSRRVRGACA